MRKLSEARKRPEKWIVEGLMRPMKRYLEYATKASDHQIGEML